jgi:17beta-estradiol 17-dehydrogenase / very-long-chain 3-oxoacyl-CoA reductase
VLHFIIDEMSQTILNEYYTLLRQLDVPQKLSLYDILFLVGVLTAISYFLLVADYALLYAFPPRKLSRYLHPNKECWALVTGASDGIGFGLAQELCLRGFNVILHSRNREKLELKKRELEAQFPKSRIAIAVGDAGENPLESAREVKKVVADKHLTVLINNLAISRVRQRVYRPLEANPENEINHIINTNVQFFGQLTANLLPKLKQDTPSLIISVGSLGSFIPSPYVQIYAATKAYQMALSSALTLEMGPEKSDVEVFGAYVGIVRSSSFLVKTGFFVPTSRTMASAILDMVGCRRKIVTPFFPHFMQQFGLILLPDWISSKILVRTVHKLKLAEDKELKKN